MKSSKDRGTLLRKTLSGGNPKKSPQGLFVPYGALDFSSIEQRANELADRIEARFEELAHVLLEYESYEVVLDETRRTLDLLRNLKENKSYFQLRVGAIAAFLPRNQPLYAFACFVLIPSFMASEVHFRIPHSMKHFFPKLLVVLGVYDSYPNIFVSHAQRTEFLRERTALKVDPKSKETLPVTDVVIFTGTSAHADQLRVIFDARTLFITNGSGHNPVVVSRDADIQKAVEATLALKLYNQGQDCAAPNAILVQQDVFREFLRTLRDELRAVRVGDYRDRQCRVGPISDPKDLVRIQDFLIDNRQWLDPTTPGIVRAYDAIVEPTIICKPLEEGGNFNEIFAPIIFVQQYEKDADLARYFEDVHYIQNAMYLTLYGTSGYVQKLIGRSVGGRLLHDKTTFLHNTHLHAEGIERGTQPYGGFGYGASSVSINGIITCKPTLPQRDIYEGIAKSLLQKKSIRIPQGLPARFTDTRYKDVQKLLRLKTVKSPYENRNLVSGVAYLDLETIAPNHPRYVQIEEKNTYQLLEAQNAEHVVNLEPHDLTVIRALRALLLHQPTLSPDEFAARLFTLPINGETSEQEKTIHQRHFFHNVYKLLFGKNSGPRLAQFLMEADKNKICELLDV